MNINKNFDFFFNETFFDEDNDENRQRNDRRFLERHFDFEIKYQ